MGFGATKKLWSLTEVKEIYENIEIMKNEKGIEEIGFKDLKLAEKFVHNMSILSSSYIDNKTKFSMQFLADIMKRMADKKLITKEDLYKLSDKEIIKKIENCSEDNISKCFEIWKNAEKINESDTEVKDKYVVSVNAKIRYTVPLVKQEGRYIRIDKISDIAKRDIEKALNYKTKKYAYLDFNF